MHYVIIILNNIVKLFAEVTVLKITANMAEVKLNEIFISEYKTKYKKGEVQEIYYALIKHSKKQIIEYIFKD